MGDMVVVVEKEEEVVVVVVGVREPDEEEELEEAGEETGDHARGSTSQSPFSSGRAEDGGGTGKDRIALTLEYRDSNSLDGRVTGLRPRNRAKYSHRRMACMIWRFHWGVCFCVDADDAVLVSNAIHATSGLI